MVRLGCAASAKTGWSMSAAARRSRQLSAQGSGAAWAFFLTRRAAHPAADHTGIREARACRSEDDERLCARQAERQIKTISQAHVSPAGPRRSKLEERALSRRLRRQPDLRIGAAEGGRGPNQGICSRVRPTAFPPRRGG